MVATESPVVVVVVSVRPEAAPVVVVVTEAAVVTAGREIQDLEVQVLFQSWTNECWCRDNMKHWHKGPFLDYNLRKERAIDGNVDITL